MDATKPAVTVITVTRRAEHLDRCVESVRKQTYSGAIRHLFVVDGDENVRAAIEGLAARAPLDVLYHGRSPDDRDGPARLSVLRNIAVSAAGPQYLAFLDDDNAWDPTHLQSLWETASRAGADIAHSQRQLFDEDGRPYTRPEFPWGRDRLTRRAIYAYCLEMGIMARGSNMVRDQFAMRFTWIDLGEWLFPPGFLQTHPFETHYGPWEWFNITVEDKALPKAIYESGLRVVCTNQPTLHYYLGGYTNKFDGDGVVWRPPAGTPTASWARDPE